MDINESTSYLKIEVLSDTIEGNVRIIHRRKICTGNPMETFTTDEVIRIDVKETPEIVPAKVVTKAKKTRKNIVEKVVEKVTNKTQNTKRVRNRNAKGHFVKDDPNTPENEAWKVVEIAKEIAPKIIPYNRPKKRRKTNKKKD